MRKGKGMTAPPIKVVPEVGDQVIILSGTGCLNRLSPFPKHPRRPLSLTVANMYARSPVSEGTLATSNLQNSGKRKLKSLLGCLELPMGIMSHPGTCSGSPGAGRRCAR